MPATGRLTVFSTVPAEGSITLIVPDSRFATYTEPPTSATPVGRLPTATVCVVLPDAQGCNAFVDGVRVWFRSKPFEGDRGRADLEQHSVPLTAGEPSLAEERRRRSGLAVDERAGSARGQPGGAQRRRSEAFADRDQLGRGLAGRDAVAAGEARSRFGPAASGPRERVERRVAKGARDRLVRGSVVSAGKTQRQPRLGRANSRAVFGFAQVRYESV